MLLDDLSDSGRGYVYITEDGGDTWTQEWSSPWIDNPMTDLVASPDRRTLWAVGENAVILKRPQP